MTLNVEKLDLALQDFCAAAFKIRRSSLVQLTVLQKANASINVINSSLSIPLRVDRISHVMPSPLILKCHQFHELLQCVPTILLKLIADLPNLLNHEKEYWYGYILQSVYQCFRSLRVYKLLQVDLDYFHNLLSDTSMCLTKLHGRSINVVSLLSLLRIVFACLSGLSVNTIELPHITSALVPYFKHGITDIRISAQNAAQFLIPTLDKSQNHFFILSAQNIRDLIAASGKSMPVISSLKLLLAYGKLSPNCEQFLKEDVFPYTLSIMCGSSRSDEKILAISLAKMLSDCHESTAVNNVPGYDHTDATVKAISGETPVTSADMAIKLSDVLSCLIKQVQSFMDACSKAEFDQTKEKFTIFRESLKEFSKQYITCDNSVLNEMLLSKNANSILLNIVIDLLQDSIIAGDNQFIRYANLMIFECWQALVKMEKGINDLFKRQQIPYLIDKVLVAITSTIAKKPLNELIQKSLFLYLDILEDIFYSTSELEQEEHRVMFLPVKKCLIDVQILKYHFLKPNSQAILCYLINESDADCEQYPDLCIEEKFASDIVKQVESYGDTSGLLRSLQRTKSLARISGNRILLRRHKLLPILQMCLEKYTNSEVENLSSQLIYSLLSDPSDASEEEDPFATLEKFLTACFEDKEDLAGIDELVTTDSNVPVLEDHATHLYRVMSLSHDEFERVLYSSRLTDVSYLVKAARNLKELSIIYDDDSKKTDKVTKIFESQIITISERFLPELACVSFKALKDAYSDTLSCLDREIYFNSLLPYLHGLHFIFEQWSRMDGGVKATLVSHGAFHLLLQELHTASTTKIITDDIVYCVLTALYNILLDPDLAKRFRITVTKKLLNYFVTSNDAEIRLLAKFCLSCIHMLLSRAEINHVPLHPSEADMLSRYLRGVGRFFGGYENLIVTIENLARVPQNWQIFLDAGIVSALKASAWNKVSYTDEILTALLNMIPEPDVSDVQRHKQKIITPLCNSVTTLLTSDPVFMKHIRTSNRIISKGLVALLCPTNSEKLGLDDIQLLYDIKRYADCIIFCDHFMAKDACSGHEKLKVQLYQAKSLYHEYNHELMEQIERQNSMPGMEYKDMMQSFCKSRILQVIKVVSKIKESSSLQAPDSVSEDISCAQELYDNEVSFMLDKTLLDCLVYNVKEVSICLLCHSKTRKLIHSHYIPKAILQEFVKALGLDPGESVFVFTPNDHPSNWQLKSAAKATFSMLCKMCDGTILSKDENLFKTKIFSKIYQKNSPGSQFQEHSVPYGQFLYKFAAGLVFRNIAPLYSSICAEIGDFSQPQHVMQSCREEILNLISAQKRLKIYMIPLPSQLPNIFPQISGWDRFVIFTNSPYGAHKLLQPGEPMVPKSLSCFMIKIGIMVFVVSLDKKLDTELEKLCPFYQIQQSDKEDATFTMKIPEDQERGKCIPQNIWWSLIGWAKKEINSTLSVGLLVKPPPKLSGKFQAGQLLKDILTSKDSITQPVIANLLPPGFELNFEKHGTLPEKVILIPSTHVILLHSPFETSSAKGYVVIGKQDSESVKNNRSEIKKEKPALYSIKKEPYILVYLEDRRKKIVVKTGFYLDDESFDVKDALPGVPTSMKYSSDDIVKELIKQVPSIIHGVLRIKGFQSLKSLLTWQESVKKFFKGNDSRPALTLDTRCIKERCIYCDMRCDVCLQPSRDHFKVMEFPTLGNVYCCSELCSKFLLSGSRECIVTDEIEDVLKGEKAIMQGCFTIDDLDYPGLKTTVQFVVCQTSEGIKGLHSIPPGTMYIKLWQRSIHKPNCIEYTIDKDFNAIEVLNPDNLNFVFSDAEVKEMMIQLHDMLIKAGIPYRYAALNLTAI